MSVDWDYIFSKIVHEEMIFIILMVASKTVGYLKPLPVPYSIPPL